jgi:hypothetical protein
MVLDHEARGTHASAAACSAQSDVQHWTKRAVAAEAAAAAAGSSTAEAQQAAAAAAAELAGLKAAHSRVESQLRQKVAELQEQRDAEVAAIAQKLDRALAACNMCVTVWWSVVLRWQHSTWLGSRPSLVVQKQPQQRYMCRTGTRAEWQAWVLSCSVLSCTI